MFFLEDIHQIATGPSWAALRQGLGGLGAHLEMGQQRFQCPLRLPSRHLQAVPTGPFQVMELQDGGEGGLEISHTNLQPLAQLTSSFS